MILSVVLMLQKKNGAMRLSMDARKLKANNQMQFRSSDFHLWLVSLCQTSY